MQERSSLTELVANACLQGWKGIQFSHLVRQTDLLYRNLWMPPSAGAIESGMWMPSFWVRSRFEPTDSGAKALNFGITVPLLPLPQTFGSDVAVTAMPSEVL